MPMKPDLTAKDSATRITTRIARPEDAQACGQICYDAFSSINEAHGFPCDFPSPEVAKGLLSMMFSTPDFYCLVAESAGRVIGSNCLDERGIIAGIGPITVDPGVQNLGGGRKLMEPVMERATERGAAGMRLVQAAFHNRSLSLYTSLGFDVREPLSCMAGAPARMECSGLCGAARAARRLGGLQRARPEGAWVRSGSRCGTSDRTRHCQREVEQEAALRDTRRSSHFSAMRRRRLIWTCKC